MGLDGEGAESKEDVWRTKLTKGKLINMQSDIPARTVWGDANMPLWWLLEAWTNRLITQDEIPKVLRQMVEEGIKRLRESDVLEWICGHKIGKLTMWLCSVRAPGEHFVYEIKKKFFVKRGINITMMTVLCGSGLMAGDAVPGLPC